MKHLSFLLQSISAQDENLSKTMFLPLAERMVEKMVKEDKIEAEAEVSNLGSPPFFGFTHSMSSSRARDHICATAVTMLLNLKGTPLLYIFVFACFLYCYNIMNCCFIIFRELGPLAVNVRLWNPQMGYSNGNCFYHVSSKYSVLRLQIGEILFDFHC